MKILQSLVLNNSIRPYLDKIIRKYKLWYLIPYKKKYYEEINNIISGVKFLVNLTGQDLAEINFLRHLLKRNIPLLTDINQPILNNKIILICNSDKQIKDYLNKFEFSPHVILFHCSDEANVHDISAYKHFEYVLRNHFSIATVFSNIYLFPLGTFHEIEEIKSDKKYLFNYICDISKSNRKEIYASLIKLKNGFIHIYSGWQSVNMLEQKTYKKKLTESIYTICPTGYVSGDSFRFWEALYYDSTPVIFKHTDTEWLVKYFSIQNYVVIINPLDIFSFLKNKNVNDEYEKKDFFLRKFNFE